MKLHAVLAVALAIGSVAAVGCKTNKEEPIKDTPPAVGESAKEVAPEDSPASAPVMDSSKPNFEQDAFFYRYYAPHAPPAARVEYVGVAPSPRHFWAPGYHRWTGYDYAWVPGRWDYARPGYEYVGPRWYAAGPRWRYTRAYWARR